MRVFREIDYVGDGIGLEHELTIYTPNAKPEAGLPVVPLHHGGGWARGDDSIIRRAADQWSGLPLQIAQRLCEELGVVAVGVNVRLTIVPGTQVTYSGYPWPTMGDDFAKAHTWITDNIADYGGDPTNIAYIGGSAGGHLVTRLYDDGIVDYSNVKGIISWSGATHKIEDYFKAGSYPFGGDIHAIEQYLFAGQAMAHTLHDDSEGFYTLMLTASSTNNIYLGHPKVHLMGSIDEGTGAQPPGWPAGIPVGAITAYHTAMNSFSGSGKWCSSFPAAGAEVVGHYDGAGTSANVEHTIDVFPGYEHGFYAEPIPSTGETGLDATFRYLTEDLGL